MADTGVIQRKCRINLSDSVIESSYLFWIIDNYRTCTQSIFWLYMCNDYFWYLLPIGFSPHNCTARRQKQVCQRLRRRNSWCSVLSILHERVTFGFLLFYLFGMWCILNFMFPHQFCSILISMLKLRNFDKQFRDFFGKFSSQRRPHCLAGLDWGLQTCFVASLSSLGLDWLIYIPKTNIIGPGRRPFFPKRKLWTNPSVSGANC